MEYSTRTPDYRKPPHTLSYPINMLYQGDKVYLKKTVKLKKVQRHSF